MLEAGITGRLDALASSLDKGGFSHLASLLDAVSNTMEKTAANKRLREFLYKKAEEWFPGKLQKIDKAVRFEIFDNLAASLLEVITPGKNKIFDKSEMLIPTDKETGGTVDYLVYNLRKLFDEAMGRIPAFAQMPQADRKEAAKNLVDNIVYREHLQKSDPSKLMDASGTIKAAPLAYLIQKVLPEGLLGVPVPAGSPSPAQLLANEVAHEKSSPGGAIEGLVKALTGGLSLKPSRDYIQLQKGGQKLDTKGLTNEEAQAALLGRIGTSKILYNKIKGLVDSSWEGPLGISVRTGNLGATFVERHAKAIDARLKSIKDSELYKDEERLQGAKARLPAFPGSSTPWNKEGVLLQNEEGSKVYTIREGWHRILAMVEEARAQGIPNFTISAFVYTKAPPGMLREVWDEVVKQWKLR